MSVESELPVTAQLIASPISAAPDAVDFAAIRSTVDQHLLRFVERRKALVDGNILPSVVSETLTALLRAGGKRLRPVLCVLGNLAAGGVPDAEVTAAAAALEMFHAFALIHDDVMDDSATRRGQPTVHRALAEHYRAMPFRRGDTSRRQRADRIGLGGAMLVGDLALCWSDALLHEAELTCAQRAAAQRVVDAMRTEVVYGQWLDLHTTGRPEADTHTPLQVIRYKTAKYTLERPLHLGAVLAGAGPEMLAGLSAFAIPIGEAFQLRDDLLGVFGDPHKVGKPIGDDLREGKRTVLLATTYGLATPVQRRALRSLVGRRRLDTEGLEQIRTVMTDTGAVAKVEQMIRVRRAEGLAALARSPVMPQAARALTDIAFHATERDT